MVGLAEAIPDEQERRDHIFHHQLYGIAITELTSLMSRRSLYCSKFPNGRYSVSRFETPEGNIRFKQTEHRFTDGRCAYCGASENQFGKEVRKGLEYHAYEFVHTLKPEDILGMKFDVIVGNPPYQLSDGGAGPSAVPIYQMFVEQAIKLKPRFLSMIIPSRWFAGGRGLDDFRKIMLENSNVRKIIDFESSKDCFSGVDIAGGVCYFLWDRDNTGLCEITNTSSVDSVKSIRKLNEFPVFIRSNRAVSIIRKVLKKDTTFMDSMVFTQKPFGFRTYARGESKPFSGSIKLLSSNGIGYVSRDEVIKNKDKIDMYKVIVGRLVPSNGELDVKPGEGYRVMTSTKILCPGEINTESYITLGVFNSYEEAKNFNTYVNQKFTRFLLRQSVSSVNINREAFRFVPVQDFSKNWQDGKLYQKYGLTDEEVEYIETLMRTMDDDGDAGQ